jgi:CheY-like chemotaxis protein
VQPMKVLRPSNLRGVALQPKTPNTSDSKPVLTSWKQVAEYMGKAVRTVQRWERDLGLPVRRQGGTGKNAVVAHPEELQEWLRTSLQPQRGVDAKTQIREQELTRLRRLTKLMTDRSEELNQRLATVIRSVNAAQARLRGGDDAPLKGFTVLAVDDNEAHNYALSRILGRSGSTVLRAFTGQQALDLAKRQPDLILLDIRLPDLDGFEVCRLLKSDPVTSGIPVVFITAVDREAVSDATAKAVGGESVLFYPVETDHLLAVIQDRLTH